MDMHAGDHRPRAPSRPWLVASGGALATGPRPFLADDLGRPYGGSARRIDLVGVMELDDLDRLVEPGRGSRKLHEQGSTDGEIRCHDDSEARHILEPGTHRVEALLVKPVVPTTA